MNDIDYETLCYLLVAAVGLAALFWIAASPPPRKRPVKLKSQYWKK